MLERIDRFITPDRTAPLWLRLLPFGLLIFMGLLAFAVAGAGWEYTNSNEFCGTSCHTMPPEYIAYQSSPHANVKCVDCHIGREYIATQFARKAQDISHVIRLIGADYEVPLYAHKLRPASEICERCHYAAKFSDASLREYQRFDAARNNQRSVTYVALKTGGGSLKEGGVTGIHWHIANKVEYIATDNPNLDQVIPWVRVTYADSGATDIFTDVNADLPANFAEQNQERLKLVDCMVCHNRISHLIRTPADALDNALAQGTVSPEIPYIKQNAVAVMERHYPSMEEARKALYGLTEYYQVNWPDYYAQNATQIYTTTRKLMEIYEGMVFPTMAVSWETHPDNNGHKEWAGCFRCHNGSMMNAEQKVISANCTTCHSVPLQNRPDGTMPELAVAQSFVPESHTESHWLARHRFAFDTTCAGCHTVTKPTALDNSSFCANSGCHGNDWQYLKLDSPKILDLVNTLDAALPAPPAAKVAWETLIGPLLAARCVACHGDQGAGRLTLTSYASTLAGGQQGPALLPGQAEASPLVQVQRAGHPNQLPAQALDWLVQWIDAGAVER